MFSCRDLIILEARVWLLHNGQCAILMTGNIVERNVNLSINLLVEFYVRGGKFSNHAYLFSCRNRFLLGILTISKDVLGRLPKVVGIDVVEMALWAKVHMIVF